MKKTLLKAVGMLCLFMFSQTTFGQMAKCKGKYFGNIISGNVPSTYTTYWNQVTSENSSKWGSVEGTINQYNFSGSDVCFNWAKNNNGLFKYHNLIWGGQTPGWVGTAATATITNNINPYFKAVADHYNAMGGLKMIDVLNEPVNTPMPGNLKAALTAGYQAEAANANDKNNQYGWAIWCFQVARKYFPNATLLINEYNIEMNWNNCRAPYIAMVNAIKNAPNLTDGQKNLIDGVGLQCHGIDNLSATNFKACLDEIWTKTGVPMHLTEFDQTANPNESKQQSVYSTLIPIAWEHPHVAGITLWGYIQGSTWIGGNGQTGPGGTDSGILYSGNYSANPYGARPAMTWLKQYLASQASLSCCPAPAPFASCTTTTCNPTAISPYLQVNGGAWVQSSTVTINSGDQVILGPQPATGGTWAWTGCGTSGSLREQTISPTGTCTATATYTNTCGATSTQAFTLTVNSPNTPPTISIASPLSNATFTAPASITINASAADANGTVSNVDFFNGTTLLGSDATSPYSFTWSNVAAGTYSLTAKATDNAGATTTSSAVTVTVGTSCSPTAITPYIQVNGGAWQQASTATINVGDQVTVGPQPATGGSWAWTGCGTSGSAREQIISPTGTCTATATYTNACGATSTQAFTLTVNPNTTTTGTGVTTYINPVIPGNHPDQTMIKVGNDFYTAGSSFHWTPNFPIYHSTDLVHWQEVAQVVSPTWSGLVGHDGPKGGTWEGALAYFANKYWAFFYIMGGGQYFSTASDPKGPWTTPTLVQGSVGYDNSVFVDDNGRAYMLMKNGQSVNRIQELNSSGQLTGSVLNMDWVNANNRFSWAEGPVMTKRNGRYYYFVAGNVYGGQYVLSSATLTANESSWTVHGNFFRGTAAGSFTGPNHISAPVQIADGTWWCLAHSYSNNNWDGQGRQSMLFQVFWDANGVPYANNPTGTTLTAPNLNVSGNYEFPESDFFNSTTRKLEWFFHNTANVQKASLSARPGYLRLSPGTGTTHILQREPAKQYSIVTKVDISATANGQQAGLKVMNGEDLVSANLYSGYNNGKKIGITFNGVTTEVNNTIGNTVWLKIVRNQHNLTGYFGANGTSWTQIGGTISVAALDQAQTNDNAWVGTSFGLFATALSADFDQFSFNHGLDPISVASYYHYNNVSISSGTVSNSVDNGWCMLPGVTMESNGVSANQIIINAASAASTGSLEVWTDNIGTAGIKIATIPISNTGGTGTYKDFTANVTVSGQHDLYLRFVGGANVFRLNTVRFGTVAANTPPTVSITSPANNASFTAPASITINANASDADGTVSNVQFYNGTTLLGSDATSPYSFTWSSVGAGTYSLTAKATDNAGAVTTSSAVTVTVTNPIVQSPFSGTPSPIPGKIEAENYDLGGAGVAFNETTAGNTGNAYRTDDVDIEPTTDAGGGYDVGWIEAGEWLEYTVNVTAAGAYNLEARVASANTGGTFHVEMDGVNISGAITVPNTAAWQTFQSVSINNINLTEGQKVMRIVMDASWFNLNYVAFTAVNTPPTVSITSPANNVSFTAPASISISTNASDADGTISNVQFFNGTTLLGSVATSPYSFTWSNVAAGTYSLTAKATDNAGAVTTSSAVTVTISNPIVQSPFSGTPLPIPGKIEAENYDLGGAGVAFNETTAGNTGNAYRTDDVDVEATTDMGGGYNVGWIEAGEWLEYTVNVTVAGVYNLEARVASANTGGTFHVEMDGVNISGAITVPNTAAWQTFQSVSINNINLTAGQKVMRIVMDASWFNLNYVAFTAACTPTAITPYTQINGGAWAQVSIATLDAGGTVTFGPQPVSGGSWSWTGPSGFTATSREITLNTIQTSQAGNYVTTYTNANGCNSTHTFSVNVPVSTAAMASLPQASVSPNPTDGPFTLSVLEPVETFRMVNGQGVIVYQGSALGAGESVSFGEGLSAGIYMIYIQYADGRTESKKVQRF